MIPDPQLASELADLRSTIDDLKRLLEDNDRYDATIVGRTDADIERRIAEAVRPFDEALRAIIEIGKRDLSNPKYDGYFNTAREVLAANRAKGKK